MHRDPEAKYRLEAAAIAGHPPARYLLQRLCAEDETGGPNDDDDAACLDPGFRGTDPPIEDRDPDPAGLPEIRGEGVGGPDHEAALWWFGAAAGRGDRRGLFNLARMYHNGSGGLLPDRVKAMEFVRQAAGLGHPEAWNSLAVSPPPLRNDLGLRFVGGRGDDEDPVEAIQWCHDRVMRGRMALECEV